MLCNRRVIVDPSAISRESGAIGNRLRSVGDWLVTVSWAFVFDCRNSATFWRSVSNLLAISRRLKTVSGLSATAATGRRSVGNQSATTKNLSTIDLVAERSHLQQPKPPCDQIVPATFCNRSATSRRPPCNHPATSRNFGRKEVADRLQAMCDRGFKVRKNPPFFLFQTDHMHQLVLVALKLWSVIPPHTHTHTKITRQIRTPVLRIPPAVTSQAKMKNWLHECQKWVSHMIGQYAHI